MTRVLVLGSGIAGPALAHWLERLGIPVVLAERDPGPRPGGQAVDLRGVARDVVARMGLEDAVDAARLRTTAFSTVDGDGRVLRTVRADDHGGDGELAAVEILRGDLARILREAADTDVRFGARLVHLDQGDDGVHVRFAGGAPERFDAVVGADGLHSQVRATAFADEPGAVRPLGTTIALWTVPDDLHLGEHALDHVDGDRFAGVRPVPGGRAVVYLAFPTRGPLPADAAGQRALVRERAAGMRWELPRLTAQLDDLYVDDCARVVLRSWSRGRIALLGDAAHCPSPLSGGGTGVALVGAYVLARELAAHPGRPAAAFAAYERRLRPWVERVQRIADGDLDAAGAAAVANAFELPPLPTAAVSP